MKTRLLGAAVLIALAVLFVPMFFSSKPAASGGDQTVNLAIPQAPDRDLQTKTMSLTPDATNGTPPATTPTTVTPAQPAAPGAPPASSDQLATVNIGSNRPRDVETDPEAGKKPVPTTVTIGSGASPAQPVIPMQTKSAASAAAIKPQPAIIQPQGVPKTAAILPSSPSAVVAHDAANASAAVAPVAGHGSYTLNLSAYASAAGAANLERRVRALGYAVSSHAISQAGQPRTLVIAGPFETRTAAEAARLKIVQSNPSVPARLEQDASHGDAVAVTQPVARPAAKLAAPVAASPEPTSVRAGGWAVQLAAMSGQADANALRDKLRANGFDGFVDSVQASGKQLWRVRAGPQTQRADAQRVREQIKAKLGIDGNVVPVP